jgi:hypothetical protein
MISVSNTGIRDSNTDTVKILAVLPVYGTYHSYVLVVHTLRVAENEILKLDLPALINAKRGSILSILCLMLVSLEFLVAAPEPFLCINNLALCP